MGTKEILLPNKITITLDKIEQRTNPVSIFVYGSRSRKDYEEQSDFEVGVFFNRDKKWGRSQLATLHNISNLNVYPFVLEDFQQYKLDTPFPKAVYLRELMAGGVTVRGQRILEAMELPEVRLTDLVEVATFQTAYALGAILSARQKDFVTTSTEFTKAALFGARALVILETGNFPLGFGEIYEEANKLNFLDEDTKAILSHAMDVRKGQPLNPELLYENITFLNQTVHLRIKNQLINGDKVILKGHAIS